MVWVAGEAVPPLLCPNTVTARLALLVVQDCAVIVYDGRVNGAGTVLTTVTTVG